MIKVAFIASKLKTGGTERQWVELIKGMDRTQFKVTVICLYDLGVMGDEMRGIGVKTYSDILKSRFSFFDLRTLSRILKQEQVDVVFLWNQPLVMIYGVIAAKVAGIRGIITAIHTTGHLETKFRAGIINRFSMPFVKKIVALGTQHKDYIVRHEHVSPEKVVIIFNGVSLKEYEQKMDKRGKKEELGIPAASKVVGIVARLHKVKRHDIFLKAAKLVLAEYNNVCFVIVGDGDEKDRISGLIQELGIGENVKMLGLRKDIPEINGILDVSVVSSETEALPMSIIEAMASSVPVVSTRVGSVEDLVTDGHNGFLVRVESPEELAGAILKLLRDEALAAAMGVKGHKIACENFSREIMVKRYEDLFRTEAFQKKD